MQYMKRKKYKYKLHKHYYIKVDIETTDKFNTNKWLGINSDGELYIYEGYTWDGATCAINTRNFMIGSLVHDALYQLIREGIIDKSYKDKCDRILHDICRDCGMSKIRAWWVLEGVKRFGHKAIKSRVITV